MYTITLPCSKACMRRAPTASCTGQRKDPGKLALTRTSKNRTVLHGQRSHTDNRQVWKPFRLIEETSHGRQGVEVSCWEAWHCEWAGMPFAHKRRHDETTITDFGAAPVHGRDDSWCQCLDLVQVKSAVGELIPGQVQSLMFRTATPACKAGTGRPPWLAGERATPHAGCSNGGAQHGQQSPQSD